MFLNQIASVARLTPTGGNSDKESYVAIAAWNAIRINIQPADAQLTAVTEGAYGQTYTAFVTISGVNIGDRITLSGTNALYIVKGVNDWNYAPIPHLELVLFKGDN